MSIQNTGRSNQEMGDDVLRPVTPKQAATILDCNVKSIYEGIRRGEIPSIKLGRLRFIPRPAFERLLRDGGGGASVKS